MDSIAKIYLELYLSTLSSEERNKYTSFDSGYFCADEVSANTCANLVQRGIKVATCSMKYWYESGGESMPQSGQLFVVTTWAGEPTSIIETISVTECKFCAVDEEFAKAEGEGDQSLEWWRKAHWDFFSEECKEIGIEPSKEMMLVQERFKVVFTGQHNQALHGTSP